MMSSSVKKQPKITIDKNGTKEWRLKNGQYHREDGPAIEYANGDKRWYLNGQLHREDGPAFEYANGTKLWYLNGKCHRENGPAVEYANGTKLCFLNDKELTEDEHANQMFIKWCTTPVEYTG